MSASRVNSEWCPEIFESGCSWGERWNCWKGRSSSLLESTIDSSFVLRFRMIVLAVPSSVIESFVQQRVALCSANWHFANQSSRVLRHKMKNCSTNWHTKESLPAGARLIEFHEENKMRRARTRSEEVPACCESENTCNFWCTSKCSGVSQPTILPDRTVHFGSSSMPKPSF